MRFIILRKADAKTEAGVMPSQALIAAMGRYHEELAKAGVLRAGEGLHPSAKGFRVRFSGGEPTVADGPFGGAGELVAGFTMIEVASREEALAWARRWPALDGDGEVELEVRRVFEPEDLGEEFTPELRAREERLRAESQGQTRGPSAGGGPVTEIQPYLFFEGRCEEAIEFYRRALGAEVQFLLRIKEAPEGPDPAMVPPGSEDKVMHASIRIGGTTILVSDGRCGGTPRFQGFSLSLVVSDAAEAERCFAALAEGGEVRTPLGETFFSPSFGMVADRFGVPWMVYVAPSDPAARARS